MHKGLYKNDLGRLNILENAFLAMGDLIASVLNGGLIGLLIGAILSFYLVTEVGLSLVLRTGLTLTDTQVDFIFIFGI